MTIFDHTAVWEAAEPYMRFRRNDVHIPVVYDFANQLAVMHPDCDPEVVTLAALLHDIGWAAVDQNELFGTAFKKLVTDVRIQHEKEGARMAREILGQLAILPTDKINEICTIIDGHDTRLDALSLNDSLVKDADKLWRFSAVGVAVSCEWHHITPGQYIYKVENEREGFLFTEAAKALGAASLASAKAIFQTEILG
ncbi:MAG: HD domain-containing protein [Chloroflexota bacterium]